MVIVFFIYGLAFFVLGFAITLYPKKNSRFKLASHLYLIAGFGLFHGINEWLDMFIMISDSPDLAIIDPAVLKIIRAITLPLSFFCLIHFGAKALPLQGGRYRIFRFLTPVLFIVWLGAFWLGESNMLMWDIWSRYILCVSGASITAWGLALQLPEFQRTKFTRAIRSLKIAAVAFFCYAIIAGLIVPKAGFFPASVLNYPSFAKTFGIPVQVFRSVCALTMAYGIIRVLSIFYWETRTRIRESEFKLSTVAAEAPVVLFVIDKDAVVTFIEGKMLDRLHLRPEDVVGRSIDDAFIDIPHLSENCKRALKGKNFVSIIKTDELYMETCLNAVKDSDGENAGLIGVVIDITRQLKTQMEFDKYRKEMAHTTRMATLGTMSDAMAQQLSKPLAVARIYLRRLLADLAKTGGGENVLGKLEDCLAEVDRATEVIEGFYSEAHIKSSPTTEPVDLQQIVQKIIAVFGESARRAGLRIETIGMDVVPSLKISSRELEQIFFILIQNAIDAAHKGKKNKLLVSCRMENHQMVLRFIDNCTGIPPEKLHNVFEPFFKVENNKKDSGFGLAIVRRIINAYGGDIHVESQVKSGTTFHITLPIEHLY